MTRARKQLLKRSDTRTAELRKLIHFATAASFETDYRLRSNVGVGEEDFLEVLGENDESVSKDFPTVSAMRCFSISMS